MMMSYDYTIMFQAERQRATFSKQHLSSVVFGSSQKVKEFKERQCIIENDHVLRFDPATIQRSRADIMKVYAQKLIRYTDIIHPHQLLFAQKTAFFPEQLPLSLHDTMFLITLRNLCDQQQTKRILEPALRREMIGCYAQTELGHGSDVKSLMTTATYEEGGDSFIMNTPTSSAAKWWIGELGVFATHACVFAQLIIKGKNHGVHAFIVPVRDKDHKPLPGIEVGDVGPKMGFNCKDNGYLIMNHFQIPRINMLMKYQKVTQEGKYEVVGSEKITYATMLRTRCLIPQAVFYICSKAVTILIRYSLARGQFKNNSGQEMPILQYQLQQQKIFPRLAETYANMFAYKQILQISDQVFHDAKKGYFSKLNESHIIASAAKAISTKDALSGMQTLRRAAGGHGFNSYSAIPSLQNEVTPTYTFEGDFTILMLQVARYLLKSYNRVHRGSKKPLGQSVAYLKKVLNTDDNKLLDTDDEEELRNPQNLIKAYIANSCFRSKKAGQKLLMGVTGGMDMKKTWDQHAGIELVDAGAAHSYLWMLNNFHQAVKRVSDKATRTALERLLVLYAIEKIMEYSTSFFQSRAISAKTVKALRGLRQKLLEEIRPDCLTLVEAFEYSDNTLMSAIGHSDGKPYDHLLNSFRNHNDVNKPQVKAQFRKINQGLLQYHKNIKSKL